MAPSGKRRSCRPWRNAFGPDSLPGDSVVFRSGVFRPLGRWMNAQGFPKRGSVVTSIDAYLHINYIYNYIYIFTVYEYVFMYVWLYLSLYIYKYICFHICTFEFKFMCVCVRDLQNHFQHVYVWKTTENSESPAWKTSQKEAPREASRKQKTKSGWVWANYNDQNRRVVTLNGGE